MNIQDINELAEVYQQLSKGMIDHDKYSWYAITHHSTAIEGSTLTEKQAVNLLEYGKTAGQKPIEEHLMVLDYFKALKYTLRTAGEEKPFTIKLIQSIASKVKRNTGEKVNTVLGTYDTAKGDFRLGSVRAGTRTFPDHKKVPAMVDELCFEVNEEIKTAITFEQRSNLAFKVHFDLVSIHPFGDGNGRTSRLMMNFIQARFNLPLSIVFKQDRLKYISALEYSRDKGDITIFYKFMYGQYEKFLKMEINLLRETPGASKKRKSK
jgi:Fic family protein